MAYTVLARRYRSQTFDDVLGQDVAARTLRNAIAAGRVAHAYLFCGTRGCSKTTMARILAKSLNCLNTDGPTAKPCLKCDSCININTGEDIDVIEIDGASNTGVDNIRQLRENAAYRPARARFKIYIIDEVHMLSTGAFNALLKILEEPPDHVKFIFATTEPNKVLATIQSRCQRFDFHNISPDVIGQQISKILNDEGIAFEPDLTVQLSRLANGSMRDALSLLDQLISAGSPPLNARQLIDLIGIPDRQKVTQLLSAIADHDGAATLNGLDEMLLTGQSASQTCEAMVEMMREAMVFQCAGAGSALLVLTDQERADLAGLAEKFDIAGLVYNITALEKLRYALKSSETSRALLEASLIRLALSEHFIGIDRLAAQVRAMPAGAIDVKKKPLTAPDSGAAISEPSVRSSSFSLDNNHAKACTPNKDTSGGDSKPFSPGGTFKPQACGCSDPMDASAVAKQWPTIAEQIGQSVRGGVAPMLLQAESVLAKNQTLHITFSDTGHGKMAMQMCQSKAAAIETALAEITGQRLTTAFACAAPVAVVTDSLLPAEPRPPAKTGRLERNEALNDPAVKMVLLGLNATPIHIEKIELPDPSETPEPSAELPIEPDEPIELEEPDELLE